MAEFACPLFVVRKHYNETTDQYTPTFERCGEPLDLETHELLYLDTEDQPGTACGEDWKVTCRGGHVLLIPDHGADDNYALIPFKQSYLTHLSLSAVRES